MYIKYPTRTIIPNIIINTISNNDITGNTSCNNTLSLISFSQSFLLICHIIFYHLPYYDI